MLKSNSKKAHENIKQYIIDNFTPENYTDTPPEDFDGIAKLIIETFRAEKYNSAEDFKYYKLNESAAFADWCAGLPSLLDTCYYYNRSAVDDLAAILEESEAEKQRFTEEEAENLLTTLIYREIKNAGRARK